MARRVSRRFGVSGAGRGFGCRGLPLFAFDTFPARGGRENGVRVWKEPGAGEGNPAPQS